MHPREVLLYYNVSGMSSGSCRQLANGAIELILPSKIAFTAVQYVSGNELVSLDHLSSSS